MRRTELSPWISKTLRSAMDLVPRKDARRTEIVTRFGSPPKAAMFALIHMRAARWSSRPAFGWRDALESDEEARKPRSPS
jgi:hypothetical protein